MTTLFDTIASTEREWLTPLYTHVDSLFSGTNLPSHDADHHLRCWIQCRELLLELDKAGVTVDSNTVKQCIIACFFHDTGLLKDIGENHGAESRLLCNLFLSDNPRFKVADKQNLLLAIEKHDDKHEKNIEAVSIKEIISTHRLITTADDLDAFGYIGVFRYIEIYLKRNVAKEVLAKKVVANLKGRFNNFWNSYSLLQKFSHLQKFRFNQTLTFFTNLDSQFASEYLVNDDHMKVYSIFEKAVLEKKMDLNGILNMVESNSTTDFVLTFFQQLKKETEIVKPFKKLIFQN
jgi:HD superfamily phosphodiesterase